MIPTQPEGITVEYREPNEPGPSLWGARSRSSKAGYWWRQDGRYKSMPDAAGSWETAELAWAHARMSVAHDPATMDSVGESVWGAARDEARATINAAERGAIEMTDKIFGELLTAWNHLNAAAKRVQEAPAADLTDACRTLEERRARMEIAIAATYQ